MRLPRIYLDAPLSGGQRLAAPPAAARHLTQVLRLREGDALIVFNGDGKDYPGRLAGPSRGAFLIELGEPGEPETPLPLEAALGIGISKGERMDFALQKAVELGVFRIAPLFTSRSMVRLSGERLSKREKHWQGVVTAACEQSGRRRIPEIAPAARLKDWLGLGHPHPLLLDHRAPRSLREAPPPGKALTLLVGPEGGLAPDERSSARAAGFTGVRLGPRILRTETAPLAALAAAQILWGDLGS